jgi:hypothetical protein
MTFTDLVSETHSPGSFQAVQWMTRGLKLSEDDLSSRQSRSTAYDSEHAEERPAMAVR